LSATNQFFSCGLYELAGMRQLAIGLAPTLAWKGLAGLRHRPSAYSSGLGRRHPLRTCAGTFFLSIRIAASYIFES
jgi:hypothetical protein